MAEQEPAPRTLFQFKSPDAGRLWRTVNDGVMGGRSEGRFRITPEKNLSFYGNLSLARNGGFASVRSPSQTLGLRAGDTIVMRVRGDGRNYSLNLYTAERRMAFSYRSFFRTRKDAWTTISIPVDRFQATSFGRTVRNLSLDPRSVTGVGITLADKKSGAFKLDIASVTVAGAQPSN